MHTLSRKERPAPVLICGDKVLELPERLLRNSIARKVSLGIATIVLATATAMLITHYVSSVAVHSLQESHDLVQAMTSAASDMEFDTVSGGISVLQYLQTGDPAYRDAYQRHSTHFRQYSDRLLALARFEQWQKPARAIASQFNELDRISTSLIALPVAGDGTSHPSAVPLQDHRAQLDRMSVLQQQIVTTIATQLKPTLKLYTIEAADTASRQMLRVLLLAGGTSLGLLLLSLLAARYVRRSIIEPVRKLSASTDAIARGDLDHRVILAGNDEYSDLAKNFNYMIDQLQSTTVSRALHEEQEIRLRTLLDGVYDYAIFSVDAHGFVNHWNQASTRILGYDAADMQGVSFARIFADKQDARLARDEGLAAIAEAGRFETDSSLTRKDGTTFHANVVVTPLTAVHSEIKGYTVVVRDITERVKAERHIEQLATKDPLTGLSNRGMLIEQMHTAIVRAARARTQLAVLFIDLDHFKAVNDTLGHAAGDDLLRECARRLTECVRELDSVARLGGDEFVVLLTDIIDTSIVAPIAQRMLDLLTTPYELHGHSAQTSASIGICFYPMDGNDVTTLMKNADIAMYHAKELNRNNFQFYAEEMNQRILQRLQLERELRAAVQNGEFVLHYQPQVVVATGKIRGVESLVRWQHPSRGLLSPAEFISVVEETGLILPLGEWILNEACRTVKAWRKTGVNVPYVVVNVSAAQLGDGLVTAVRNALIEHEMEPGWLMLEITETMLMAHVEEAIAILRRIRELGIRIAMDDFGTGYSSLSVLQRLPLDMLKIDRSFVVTIDDDAGNARAVAIIGAIIAIAKELNLGVVAEGVDSTTQLAFLRTLNCDTYQGYLFSKPVDAAAIERLFAAPVRSVLEDHNGRAITMTTKVSMELPVDAH